MRSALAAHAVLTDEPAPPPNRSMPANTVIPVLLYPDLRAAVAWLGAAFGFDERLRVGDHRAQLCFGSACIVAAQSDPPYPLGVNSTHATMVRVAARPGPFAHESRSKTRNSPPSRIGCHSGCSSSASVNSPLIRSAARYAYGDPRSK